MPALQDMTRTERLAHEADAMYELLRDVAMGAYHQYDFEKLQHRAGRLVDRVDGVTAADRILT